ncbi:uncharacterized protein MONBRDRAFT_30437 [Monosiga brevicollis MX1]|uniref:PARP n=1 Tax=Monosiga brevicollis TaxID=81824 RepID=A9VDY4_MONBE|nr:uncharacterized protein MONBRDRAFT_30437 [Monosiga brevicollis MX1]EDQ84255.1 predicted protein [Monosiga brevicollis MX1]|eukprot:XP_001750930.1 hypothetical protein [Monosiga brevicollis MX1]
MAGLQYTMPAIKSMSRCLEMLVEHGADAKAMDDVSTSHLLFRLMMYGRTPLHYACHTGRIMVVLMLLEHGVDAKAQNKVNTSLFPINLPLLGGRAPLHYACYNGHVKVVETLLEHGVDAEAKDESHRYTDPPRGSNRLGPNDERTLIITRALLGHAFVHHSPSRGALAPPLLPDAPNNERYDSVIATPPGECHEIILFDNTQIYPELVVYYTAN